MCRQALQVYQSPAGPRSRTLILESDREPGQVVRKASLWKTADVTCRWIKEVAICTCEHLLDHVRRKTLHLYSLINVMS